MASSRWQRRHYETIAEGLKAKNAPESEVNEWIAKFSRDNPNFRADYFIAAVRGGSISRRGVSREYRPVSRPKRKFRVPSLAGYRSKSGRCKFGKKRAHGRWVCRRSPRRKS